MPTEVSDRLLDKLQKIKAHADSAKKIGSEAEAQAFADMLQKLLLDHDLQLSDLEFERMERTEPIEDQYVNWHDHGVKVKNNRVEWQERLAMMIAKHNFCRILVCPGTNNFWLVGRREHRAVAEYMIVTLTRALDAIATKEYGRYFRECYARGVVHEARGFRESFITGFLYRLFERLETRKKAAGDSTSTALMRLNREDKAVDDELERRRELKKGDAGHIRNLRGLQRAAPSSREGLRRGQRAADDVNLDGRALENTSTVRRRLR